MHLASTLFLCVLLLGVVNAGMFWLMTNADRPPSATAATPKPAEPVNFLSHPIKPQARHVVAMFAHPGCGHSRAMAPVWNQAVETLSEDPSVRLVAVHPDSTALLRLNGIEAFPTVLWGPSLEQALTHEYDGARNPAALVGAVARGVADPAWRQLRAPKMAEPAQAEVAQDEASDEAATVPGTPPQSPPKRTRSRRARSTRSTVRA